jgi:hypothetical protein
VHFADEVRFLFGPDDSLQMIETTFLHSDALIAWCAKPWGKFARPWVWLLEIYEPIHQGARFMNQFINFRLGGGDAMRRQEPQSEVVDPMSGIIP